ncbi:MAG: type II secretion system F family protein [Actinomycetota bacterium]
MSAIGEDAPFWAGGSALVNVGSALAALALLLIASGVALHGRAAMVERLIVPLANHSPSTRSLKVWLLSSFAAIGRGPIAQRLAQSERLRRRLELAGDPISLEALMGAKLATAVFAAGPFLLAGTTFWPAILATVPVAQCAFRVPDFIVARHVRRRRSRMSRQVPELAELLLATTGAGLNPSLALRRSAGILDRPLGEEVRAAVRRLDLGAPWHVTLQDLAERTADPSIHQLVRAMGRSQRLGTPLASALHHVAEELRNERQAGAEERARRAPVKMLFPLVFLILPAFLLLTVGPVLLATIRTLH